LGRYSEKVEKGEIILEAIQYTQRWLSRKKIPYMIIGGIANIVWGEPRFTRDIDIKVWVNQEKMEDFIREVKKNFHIMVEDPMSFIQKTMVLPVKIQEVKVDFIFASLKYEEEALKRIKIKRINKIKIRVCSPEDLIIHKAISERAKDWEDIQGIILRQKKLDFRYILRWLRYFSSALHRDLITPFQKIRRG